MYAVYEQHVPSEWYSVLMLDAWECFLVCLSNLYIRCSIYQL